LPRASRGGVTQNNSAHHVELLAGLSAVDFLRKDRPSNGIALGAQREPGAIRWQDLPHWNKSDLAGRITQLSRAAFAFLSVYHPVLKNLNGKVHTAPWITSHFFRGRDRVTISDTQVQDDLEALVEFVQAFLLWWASISAAESTKHSLMPSQAFANSTNGDSSLRNPFSFDDFFSLSSISRQKEEHALHKVWEYVSDTKREKSMGHVESLFNAVYDGCSEENVFS
jgi:hypothetical protein